MYLYNLVRLWWLSHIFTDVKEDLFCEEELAAVQKGLKHNKAPGADRVENEFLKYGGSEVRNKLLKYLTILRKP